jgi:hypothetical protein
MSHESELGPASNAKLRQLTEEEFSSKYRQSEKLGDVADEGVGFPNVAARLRAIEEGTYQPKSPIWYALPHLNDWWLVQHLRLAAKESPEAYVARLWYFLDCFLGASPPDGVFVEFGDPERHERSRIRSAWLDQKMNERARWTSDLDIQHAGGPTYNTIRRYRSGAKSTRNQYVRRLLAEAFNCDIEEVPQ